MSLVKLIVKCPLFTWCYDIDLPDIEISIWRPNSPGGQCRFSLGGQCGLWEANVREINVRQINVREINVREVHVVTPFRFSLNLSLIQDSPIMKIVKFERG